MLNKQELTPTAPTLTHGRFVYLADQICRRDLRHQKDVLKKPKNHAQFDREYEAVLKGYENAIDDLRGLAPPAADAKSFRHMLARFNLQDLLGHNGLEAADLGQRARVKAITKKLDANDKVLNERANSIDLHACANE